jgi:hypothetical protein
MAPVALVVGVAVTWWALRVPGEVVGRIAVPGTMDLVLGVGDSLGFTADTDVVFDRPKRKAVPQGCALTLTLVRDGVDLATTTCDLFKTSPATNLIGSNSESAEDGKTRLKILEQHLGCALVAPSAGPATLRASTNVTACVPHAYSVTVTALLSKP